MGIDSYASIATVQPYGLIALRSRGIKYWWSGLGLLVLGFMYVAPMAASFRVPAYPTRTSSLPSLSVPAVPFPAFSVPALRPQAPLPALHRSPSSAAAATNARRRTHTVRVPIVTDTHTQAAAPHAQRKAPAKDLFAGAPVVSDSIGIPTALPAATPAPSPPVAGAASTPDVTASSGATREPESLSVRDERAAAATAPPTPTPMPAPVSDGGYTWLSVPGNPSQSGIGSDSALPSADNAAAGTPAPQKQTVTVGAGGTGTLDASAAGGTGGANAVQLNATPGSSSPTGAGSLQTTSDQSAQVTAAGATGSGTSSSGTTGGTGSTTPVSHPSDSTTTPANADRPCSDPAAVPGSGPSPPAACAVTVSSDSAHAISITLAGENIVVTIDGTATQIALLRVTSLTVTGGSKNDSFSISGAVSIPVTLVGGGGADTLTNHDTDAKWTIAGGGSGTSGGASFSGMQTLVNARGDSVTFGTAPATADTTQVVYLNLGGASGVTFNGPVTVTGIDVPAFTAVAALHGQEAAIVSSLVASLPNRLADMNVTFTTTRPAAGTEYSTIYIGGSDAAFKSYGSFSGLSEDVDPGNVKHSDNAFVFTDQIPALGQTAQSYGVQLSDYVVHEVGHLLGFEHVLEAAVDPMTALSDVAWKPYTHVEMAKDIRMDLLADGKLSINGQLPDGTPFSNQYSVNPKILEAIRSYPGSYYSGAVGPDGFPDLTFGQRILHPNDTGTWLARIFDMAWAAQGSSEFTGSEKQQILSFSYGFATHAAGDFFAHTLVNEFADGVFPAVGDIIAGPAKGDDLANAIRHLLVEGYMGDATPGFDNFKDRSLLPNGDLSDDSTPGITYEAPFRFIYDTLIAPFPGDPTSPADTGRIGAALSADATTNQFVRTSASGSFRHDGFLAGMDFFSFGFGNAANQGRFRVISVTDTTLTVAVRHDSLGVLQPLVSQTGDSTAALAARGDRGPLLDLFFIIQRRVDDQLDSMGGPTSQTLQELFNQVIVDPHGASSTLISDLTRAYLANWSHEIDLGVQNWAAVGLASTKALFDPATRRFWQNEQTQNEGSDVDPARAAAEKIGTLDIFLSELDDPNHDGKTDDSYISNHLLPMLGIPTFLADFRTALTDFTSLLDDLVIAPIRLLLAPVKAAIAEVKQIVKNYIEHAIEDRFGVNFDEFEQLSKLSNKMDLASVTVSGHTIPIFKPGDHAKLDGYMGIRGVALSEPMTPADRAAFHAIGLDFYPTAVQRLNDNVEFDKTKFAAYADSVTLGKMLLLQETDPLGGVTAGDGGLSHLVRNALNSLNPLAPPSTYDWSLLNMVGGHGGNVMTTTLPKPVTALAVTVGSSADTFDLPSGHGLHTGDAVLYQSGGTAAGDVISGAGYIVRFVPSTASVHLYLTVEDALADSNRVHIAGGSGTQTLTAAVIAEVQALQPDMGGLSFLQGKGILLDTFHIAVKPDSRPWLRLIDANNQWRQDTLSMTNGLFQIHAPGTGGDYAEWVAPVAAGDYSIQATWLFNVTQRLDNPISEPPCCSGTPTRPADSPVAIRDITLDIVDIKNTALDDNFKDDHLKPATDAIYDIYDGANPTPIATVHVDQSMFPTQFLDDTLSLGFNGLDDGSHANGVYHIANGYLRVVLRANGTGYVSAGPLRVATGANPKVLVVDVTRAVDPVAGPSPAKVNVTETTGCAASATLCTATVFTTASRTLNEGSTVGDGWVQFGYDGGTGNFPLWESSILRPVWRAYFRDWQNGALQFPDLGDTTSPDPNSGTPIVPNVHPGPYVTPFTPAPADPVFITPTAVSIAAPGAVSYTGTTYLSSITAVGSVSITVAPVTTGVTTLLATSHAFKRTAGSFITAGFAVGQELVTHGFAVDNGTYHVTMVAADTLTVSEVLFEESSGTGDEQITSPGKLVFAGSFAGVGLTGLTVGADAIEVKSGVGIAAGSIALSAKKISLAEGASVTSTGDVALTAATTDDVRFELSSHGLKLVGPESSVELESGAHIAGANVTLTATATAGANAHLSDAVKELLNALPVAVGLLATTFRILGSLGATSWTPQAAMTTPREGAGAAAINGLIYVVGGQNGGGDLATLEIYDPAADSWTSGAAMPTARHGAAVAAIGSKLYVAGGSNGVALDTLEIYDSTANTWATGPVLSFAAEARGATLNGLFYVVASCSSAVASYDPATNSWSARASRTGTTCDPAVAADGGKLYVFGGSSAGLPVDTAEIYDATADTWSAAAPLPAVRSGAAAAVFGGSIYVLGGDGTTPFLPTVDVYHPATNLWNTSSAMPTGRTLLVAAPVGSSLYAIGGEAAGPIPSGANEAFNLTSFLPKSVGDGLISAADIIEKGESLLRKAIGAVGDKLFQMPSGTQANAQFAKAKAEITLASAAHVDGSGDVTLRARAISSSVSETAAQKLVLNYASTEPEANVEIAAGASLTAGGHLQLEATTLNTLDLLTKIDATGNTAELSASFGKTRSEASANVAPGARLQAATVTVFSEAVNSISNVALSSGYLDSGSAGGGATLALGFYQSAAASTVAGFVTTTGDVVVDARSRDIKNETRAFAQIDSAAPPNEQRSGVGSTIDSLLSSLHLSQNANGHNVDPTSSGGGGSLKIGAAVVLVDMENKAAALVDDGAKLAIGGNLTVTSLAETTPIFTATATVTASTGAGPSADPAIGGAVAWDKVANQATSFIGYNALVDVAHVLHATSAANIKSPEPAYNPSLTIPTGSTYADANTAAGGISTALDGVPAYLAPFLADRTKIGTSYVFAASGGDGSAFSGGIDVLDVYNMAASGIAPGALVNQCFAAGTCATLTAGADQDVLLDSTATVETVNIAGLESALSVPAGGGTSDKSGGGYFSGFFPSNSARSYIDDRTAVTAARDVSLHALTDTRTLNIVKQGSSGKSLAIEGAFAFVVTGHESLAFIEDRATVAAGRDVVLDAKNKDLIVNLAGVNAVGDTAIGIAVAFTMDWVASDHRDRGSEADSGSTVRAYIGDSNKAIELDPNFNPATDTPTGGVFGSVTAGRNIMLSAGDDPALDAFWIGRSARRRTRPIRPRVTT